jgi:hypothetical protein
VSGVLGWEDPPPRSAPKRRLRGSPIADWWHIAAQLRGRPGRWAAALEGCGPQQATYIRQGRLNAFKPAGSFDARACRVSGMYTLYVRYVGARADLRPIEEATDGVRS